VVSTKTVPQRRVRSLESVIREGFASDCIIRQTGTNSRCLESETHPVLVLWETKQLHRPV
jgi:hypothetical protein